jgi:hypothetical protein
MASIFGDENQTKGQSLNIDDVYDRLGFANKDGILFIRSNLKYEESFMAGKLSKYTRSSIISV